ncbi:MAG: zinc ribbon domain-containing protein [Candidatus Wukongarchaeota archaeon]|nr:zinc ribbon domain-containing protein [Candidatus Wukongarchaeota archaeon]
MNFAQNTFRIKKLLSPSYGKLTSFLEYKLKRVDIVLKKVSEKEYTSRMCHTCGDGKRKNHTKKGKL